MSRKGVALVAAVAIVAAAGTAGAASRYVITSSRQIKPGAIALKNLSPKARRALQGHRGAPGPRGPAGFSTVAGEAVRNTVQPFGAAGATVATLHLGPGAYMLSAHTTVAFASSTTPLTTALVTCTLTAGADGDASQAEFTSTPQRTTLPLVLTHTFAAAGVATLRCAVASSSGAVYTAAVTKVVALRVASETHATVTG
jgi:hypothetical protein